MDKVQRRRDIWKKTGGRCAHCGKMAAAHDQTIDHYIPRSWGGTFDRRNLMPLCRECNWERKAQEINPAKFYKYAPAHIIAACRSYEKAFNRNYCAYYSMADAEMAM